MNPVALPPAIGAPASPAAFDHAGDSPLAVALRRPATEPEAGVSRVGFNSFVGE